MKKFKLFTLAFMFVAAVIFVASFSVNAEDRFNESFLELNSKQNGTAEKIDEIIVEDSYPSYFGGMYISDDSTHLVIQIVEDNIPATKDSKGYESFNQIKGIDGNIEYEYVKNSYIELNEINDKLIEHFSSEKADLENLNANYIDTFKNVVVVELLDNSLKQVDTFKETVLGNDSFKGLELTSDTIIFTQGEKHENYAINAGEQISIPGGSCSMGYRVKINGDKGYITAGHCFDAVGDSATGGTVEELTYGGSVDAAFVDTTWWTNTFNAPSNNLEYTSGSITVLDNTLCPFLTVNGAIAKSGFTTEYTSGQIRSLNYSGNYDGTYFTGLIATSMNATFGDSGGAVFVPSNVNGGAPLAGIIKGGSTWGAAFTSADNIYADFGYTRY